MASEAPGATAPDTAAPTPTPKPAPEGHGAQSFWALAIGSIGVVFGDIGTSPLYAMREAAASHPQRRDQPNSPCWAWCRW
jgi:KUP system potassium uptake protein